MFDVSPVYRAAYDATSVKADSRGLDAFKKEEEAEAEREKVNALMEKAKQMEKELEEDKPSDKEPKEDVEDKPSNNEEPKSVEPTDESPKDDEEDDNNKHDNNLTNKRTMEKFSLLKAINSIANNKQLDERSAEVVNAGVAEMRKSGLSYSGQIQLPIEERADV